jgi:hypothetical protein
MNEGKEKEGRRAKEGRKAKEGLIKPCRLCPQFPLRFC